MLNVLSVLGQVSGLIVWPFLVNEKDIWLIPLSITLISFRWWENFLANSICGGKMQFDTLSKFREQLEKSRYYTYLFVAPWKIIVFFIAGFWISGIPFRDFFYSFTDGWKPHSIDVFEVLPLYNETNPVEKLTLRTTSTPNVVLWVFIFHSVSSWIVYVFSKFAAKVYIQSFSMAFPLNLTVPATVGVLAAICLVRAENVCAFHGVFPDFLFFNDPPLYYFGEFVINDYAWVWLFWLCSQAWITKYLWNQKNDKNAASEKLFVLPMYCSLLVDQCVALNRRREDQSEVLKKKVHSRP